MLRILSTLVVFFCVAFGSTMTYREELRNLTPRQYAVLMYSLEAGRSEDLGLTLAAIAWKESSFGKNKVNPGDGKHGSYGSHQILLTSAAAHLKDQGLVNVNLNSEQKDIMIHYLTKNEDVSIRFALEELKYRQKKHKGNYRKMLASYNAGHAGLSSPAGAKYARDVAYRVRLLEEFINSSYVASK